MKEKIQEIHIERTRIELLPFTYPDQYPNLKYFQEMENRLLKCESVLDWMDIFNGQVTFSSGCDGVRVSSPSPLSTAHDSNSASVSEKMTHTTPEVLLTTEDQVKSSTTPRVFSTSPTQQRWTSPTFDPHANATEKGEISSEEPKETIITSSLPPPTANVSTSMSTFPDKISVTPLHTSPTRTQSPVTPSTTRGLSPSSLLPSSISSPSLLVEKLSFSFSLLGLLSFLGNVSLWFVMMKCKVRSNQRRALSSFPPSFFLNHNYELHPHNNQTIFREIFPIDRMERGAGEDGNGEDEEGEEMV